MDNFEVTKLDAGRRQMRTAIRLWFADDDAVSIFSLAYASHEVIHKLHKKGGGSHGLIFESPAMTEAAQTRVTLGLKKWGNFLKHADRDHDGKFTFNPEIAELLMLASLNALRSLTEEMAMEEAALSLWWAARYPEAYHRLENPEFHALIRANYNTKPEFWAFMQANWGTRIKCVGGNPKPVENPQ